MVGLDGYRSTLSSTCAVAPLLGLALRSHTNTRGEPMRFRDRPYLVELYRDLPTLDGVDICKGVQTGISELLLLFALERTGWAGKIAAYVLPTYSVRDRFVQRRVNPLLQAVPDYRARLGGDDRATKQTGKAGGNLKLKRFGPGAILFLGSNTPTDFVEFTADVLIVDEFDQCDPDNLTKARDRLRASDRPQFIRIGNPTLPGVGIAALYDRSDRRRWFTKCDRCGHWQSVGWLSHVVHKDDSGRWQLRDRDARPVCERCHKGFDRGAHSGAWVAEFTDRARRGYRISRLDATSEDYRSLFGEWCDAQGDSSALAAFHTSVLGQPFEFSGARITMEMLADAAVGEAIDYAGGDHLDGQLVTMGVDVGSVLNVSISVVEEDEREGHDEPVIVRRVIFVGAFRTFAEVSDAVRRYRVAVCVIDAMPETRMAKGLRDEFLGSGTQVWLCRFAPTARVGKHSYGLRQDWQEQVVTVDRTQVFDACFDDLREGRREFPEDAFTVLGWREQLRAPVRVLDEAKQRIVWTEGSNPDHYRLADVYDRVAYDLAASGGSYHAS